MGRILVICFVIGCGGGDDGIVPGGECSDAPAEATGEGTYYAADGTGNCSFESSPSDLLVTAMNALVDPEIIELSDDVFREPIMIALSRSRYEPRQADSALRPSCRSYTFSLDKLTQNEIELGFE